jgi:hypothetical protein
VIPGCDLLSVAITIYVLFFYISQPATRSTTIFANKVVKTAVYQRPSVTSKKSVGNPTITGRSKP